MIIQCISCGFSKQLNPRGTADELEQRVNDTIVEGWRYSPNYKGWVCKNCKQDPLHEAFCGKIKKTTKEKSYMHLMYDFTDFVRNLLEIDEILRRQA